MKIVQITAVVENASLGEEIYPRQDATIYGLGDDNKPYYWGVTKSTRIDQEPDEEGNTYYYEREYGWKEVTL